MSKASREYKSDCKRYNQFRSIGQPIFTKHMQSLHGYRAYRHEFHTFEKALQKSISRDNL